jgi:uncharacterized membrane protein (UPF0182 family)
MWPRRRWLQLGLVAALAALLFGRWLAVHTVDVLWAEALGVAPAHRAISGLRLILSALAYTAAAVWCTGNLYLIYRSIGSVQVPRRVGKVEVVENVPRRYLLAGAVGAGLLLSFGISHGAGDWWIPRALLDAGVVVGVRDPVLDRDLGYYLFQLPWARIIHHFVLLLTGIILALTVLLYTAIGAIGWSKRRVTVTDLARTHVGVLLVVFALALFWGYRLEPAEYVAGLHDVPYDVILTSVRIPVAGLLAVIALIVAGISGLWIWWGRSALVLSAWVGLALASFAGHYVAPTIAASTRTEEHRVDRQLTAAATESVRRAFGLYADTVMAPLAIPDLDFTDRHSEALSKVPIWDGFAVTDILNRVAQLRPADRFFEANLAAYPDARGGMDPVYLAAREVDTAVARENDRSITWERRHAAPYAYATGAVAVHAAAVSIEGLPLYIPDVARPESTLAAPTDLQLAAAEIWFAPGSEDFAVAAQEDGPFAGIEAGGFLRRLALAWTLQSPSMVTSAIVRRSTVVLSDRAVARRLARVAPFARFGAAYPVVSDGKLLWVSAGHVWAEAYPLSVPTIWRGRRVRYLRSGLVGTVEARSGETRLYLTPDADPLSSAWRVLVPEVVAPADSIPPEILPLLRYPDEVFTVQLNLLRRTDWRPGSDGGVARAPERFWWVGPSPGDPEPRLRRRAVLEVQVEPRVSALVEGTVVDGGATLRVIAYPEPFTLPGPSELLDEFAEDAGPEAAIPGVLKLVPFDDGAIAVQAFYAVPGVATGPPRLAEVAVGWRGAVGRGRDLPAALRRISISAEREGARPDVWQEARQWFEQLDAARAAGDWAAFGEAYSALKRLFQSTRQ